VPGTKVCAAVISEQGDAYYSTAAAVEVLNDWYRAEKEEAFVDDVVRDLNIPPGLPPGLPIVEIGGGAGVQGLQMRRHFGDRYIHTDLSPQMVESARRKGLASQVADGLATPFASRSVAAVFLVGTSTLLRDEPRRIGQFRECARILAPGGVGIFVTSALGWMGKMHCLDRRDFGLLANEGLEVTSRRRWGIVPGRLWSSSAKRLLAGVERVCSAGGLGVRQIVVARKR
jgi:SAM-dependent methyltransferase